MVTESEVPLGTAEPVLFPGAPVVPKGTQCLDYPIFPALKRWAIFSEHRRQIRPYLQSFQTEPLLIAAGLPEHFLRVLRPALVILSAATIHE